MTPRHGLTLIELLAVVVILSMIAGAATIGLVGSSDAAHLRAAVAGWQDLDARARIAARCVGPVRMAIDHDRGAVVLRRGGDLLAELQLPAGITVHLEGSGAIDRIAMDGHGRSIDYDVAITLGERVERFAVCGLTGAIKESER